MSLPAFITAENVFVAASILTSGMAAWRWKQASVVEIPPPAVIKEQPVNPSTGLPSIGMSTERDNTRALNASQAGIQRAVVDSAKLNAAGAWWAMLTAILLLGALASKLLLSDATCCDRPSEQAISQQADPGSGPG